MNPPLQHRAKSWKRRNRTVTLLALLETDDRAMREDIQIIVVGQKQLYELCVCTFSKTSAECWFLKIEFATPGLC